jgi:membrane protease YdiL (CAAX protease family)
MPFGWPIEFRRIFSGWHRTALNHAAGLRQSRTIPAWVALTVILCDFVLVGVWFRGTRELSIGAWAAWDVILYLARLVNVTVALVWACRHYRVSGEAVGIRPSRALSDLRWSIKCCLVGATIVGTAIAICFLAACWLGIRLPPPPQIAAELLGSAHWNTRHIMTLGILGATGVLLAPFTEELIYRSLLFPALTPRIGFYAAVAVTAVVFGLVHVIPIGEVAIPVPQIVGGLMMAAAFSIRWSVIPAMVLHALGNLCVGILCLLYARLHEADPTLFLSQ